jgi:hypothetical protein
MTTQHLHQFLGAFVFVTIDGSPALARLGFQQHPPVFFLERIPRPQSAESSYGRFVDLTKQQIAGFKVNSPALIFSSLKFKTKDLMEAKTHQSSNAGIWNR